MSTDLRFTKYEGAGNDFVMLLDLDDERSLEAPAVVALCDRRKGIGADGVIRVVRTDHEGASFFMDYRNADGSVAEMCGNGIRCVTRLVLDEGLSHERELVVLTRAGAKHVRTEGDPDNGQLTVEMGTPSFTKAAIPMRGPAWESFLGEPLEIGELTVKASAMSMGNPHVVLFVDDDPDRFHVAHMGPVVEHHEMFPEGANVEFAQILGDVIKARVWERGAGETMACGSGACAVAVAAHEAGLSAAKTVVSFPGGPLEVERLGDGSVLLTGGARRIFEGVVDVGRLVAERSK